MTLRAAAGVRGGGDEVLEVGAKGMGAALTGPVPRWGGPEDPGFLRWPGRLRGWTLQEEPSTDSALFGGIC